MPAIALAASWMESTKLPLREIKKRYKKSEMAIMAWRSSEMAFNMKANLHVPQGQRVAQPQQREELHSAVSDDALALLERRLGPIVSKLENKNGEIDLGQLTGEEALRYMNAMGMPFAPGVTREIRKDG